jgi:hypothetical protein
LLFGTKTPGVKLDEFPAINTPELENIVPVGTNSSEILLGAFFVINEPGTVVLIFFGPLLNLIIPLLGGYEGSRVV